MIHVKRSVENPPPSLNPERTSAARVTARNFFADLPPNWRAQRRFDFDYSVWLHPDVPRALHDTFGGKCAFCESPVDADPHRHIHHFRPTSNARDKFRDEVSAEHYWWLAYEWENLYLACDVCARSKADQFPVGTRGRAPAESTGPLLESEQPLLLDPCLDEPAQYLEFRGDGRVYSLDGDNPRVSRGEATIFVFNLNRQELVRQRLELISRLRTIALDEIVANPSRLFSMVGDEMEEWFNPTLPFAALRRGLVMETARKVGWGTMSVALKFLEKFGWDFGWMDAYRPVEQQRLEGVALSASAVEPSTAPPPARTKAKRATRPAVILKNSTVTEVAISNFRAIRELSLTVDRDVKAQEQAQSGQVPTVVAQSVASPTAVGEREWRVLLGENGAGKSTVIQALCLALAGKAHVEKARKLGYFDPADALRVAPEDEEQPEAGTVTVKLTDSTIVFTFDRKGFSFTQGEEGAGTFLRAYGSTRLLPRAKSRRSPERKPVRIDNLFDPFTPLHNADEWIARLGREVSGASQHAAAAQTRLDEARRASRGKREIAGLQRRLETWTKKLRFAEDRFNAVALALKDLLRLDDASTVRVGDDGKTVLIDYGAFEMPIRKLSDGFQTVIALAVDIMAGIPTREADFRNASGIILLDELGTHLHPRWRMEIVGSLRRTFSGMQFIATTHEPLCLRGLREGEIAVMRRDEDEISLVTDLPSPEKLRVDQLLTSPFFGLYTTIDPDLDRRFQRYYDLLAKPALTADEERERAELRDDLAQYSFLGYTRRDQLVLDVVDRFLARKRAEKSPAAELDDDTRGEILRIWENVGRLTGVET